LYQHLRDLDVEVTSLDRCHSAAVTVAMAGKVIRMRSDAKMMIHAPVAHGLGTPAELRACADRLAGITEEVLGVISGRTGQTPALVREWLSRDTWLNAKEALDAGLVDELVTPPRLLRPSEVSLPAPILSTGPTDDERMIQTLLTGLGTVQVRDKATFGRELVQWFNRSVREV
jgi:hypothetical protein